MRYQALLTARLEAKRFLEKADELAANDKKLRKTTDIGPFVIDGYPKIIAAVKRASMDLTRALAEMRKP